MIRIAVVLFPGTNCEDETLRMVRAAGMEAELFRWNRDASELESFDGYIIAGGFSYEDRGRSGLIASFDPIMNTLRAQAASGKPLLGICNGAQILVETGMVPGLHDDSLSLCLAWNKRVKDGHVQGDWVSRWSYMKMDVPEGRCAFNMFDAGQVMRVPIAHGEGRFVAFDPAILDELKENDQTVFRYCDKDGNFTDEYPVNPNGSLYGLAAVCNKEGNVMAMMPHPERTLEPMNHVYMDHIFQSMRMWIEQKKGSSYEAVKERGATAYDLIDVPKVDFALLVRLIITDNEEWTLDQTAKQIGFDDVTLTKQVWWGVETDHEDKEMVAAKVLESSELANLNKEHVDMEMGHSDVSPQSFLVRQMDDMKELAKLEHFQKHYPELKITAIYRGTLWSLGGADAGKAKAVADSFLLHNPHSMTIAQYS